MSNRNSMIKWALWYWIVCIFCGVIGLGFDVGELKVLMVVFFIMTCVAIVAALGNKP